MSRVQVPLRSFDTVGLTALRVVHGAVSVPKPTILPPAPGEPD